MSLTTIGPGDNIPHSCSVVIEISADAPPVKYEVDKDSGLLMVDRILTTSMQYPANYGYVPQTLCPDNDPLDIVLLSLYPIVPGAVVEARVIGQLMMEDEAGEDFKVLAVPVDSVCPFSVNIRALEDVPVATLAKIEHFFRHYKDLDEGKWVRLDGWRDEKVARQSLTDSVDCYRRSLD